MIRGSVTALREAVVPLGIIGTTGFVDVSAVIDTGFDSAINVPEPLLLSIGAPFVTQAILYLADG